jgi:hypothetical protein
MRIIITACLVLITAWLPSALAVDIPVLLDQPGVMDAIRRDDLARYNHIQAVLDLAEEAGCGQGLSDALKKLGASGASCTGYSMSDPPRTRLLFELAGTRYSTGFTPRSHQVGQHKRNAD